MSGVGRLVRRLHAPTAVQVLGAAAIVVGVLLLTGLAWAFVAGGVAALAFGVAAEVA